jgi:hypothetical protein
MTTVHQLTEVLITLAEDADGDTTEINALLSAAKSALLTGGGSVGSLIASTVNGKSFTKQISLSPAQVMEACQDALRAIAGNERRVGGSYADFRFLSR